MDVPRTAYIAARRRRRFVLGMLGACLLAGGAYALVQLEPAAISVERGEVMIATVQHGEFVRQVRGPGVLVPRDSRWLAAQAPGRVERILLKPGAVVQPDSVIAVLSNPELERIVQEAEWAVAQGEAELAAMKLQLQGQVLDQKSRVAEARANYESTRLQAEAEADAARLQAVSQLQARRSRILAEQLAVRLQVEDDRLANLADATRAQLRAQSARLEQLKNVLARQRQQLESLQLRAGMTGVVQALAVQVGQQLAAGAQVARVAALHDLVAELQIPEVNARDLMAGQAAHIDTRNGIAEGKVSRVDPAVANGAVRVEVQFTGELPHGARPDLSVDGVIEIERRPDSLYVARPATGDPESRASVFRLDPDGHARRIAVQLGKASVSEVQVLAGLAAGDRIIVSDVSQWSSSDELRIR
ncbi:MAG TPA: HlyD family efflux transporter periplasmic adaptor subunit [Steroidobacteraceae bacterium]|nr:HlyD family efflux transporter periplasmic adaptor subunit [Steroidobacteraceae bacterium]